MAVLAGSTVGVLSREGAANTGRAFWETGSIIKSSYSYLRLTMEEFVKV